MPRHDTTAQALAREAREVARKADASRPSKRWLAATSTLLNICQVDSKADLPPVWHQMASAGVWTDWNTIQYHLKMHPALPDRAQNEQAPVCSTKLAKELGALIFAPLDCDNLSSGFSIFSVCYPDQASVTKANEVAGYYDNQMSGVTSLSLADVQYTQ